MELHCDICVRKRVFERPSCVGHPRATCPDWACTGCGGTVEIAPVIMLVDRRTRVVVRRAA